MTLAALSIRQPWAMSIVKGTKRIENRRWSTSRRGPFLIHAGKGLTRDELEGWADMIRGEDIRWPGLRDRRWRVDDFERGGIVGMASLVDVVRHASTLQTIGMPDQQPWFFGPIGFVLADVRALPFIPCKGALGFFDPGPAVQARVAELLAG